MDNSSLCGISFLFLLSQPLNPGSWEMNEGIYDPAPAVESSPSKPFISYQRERVDESVMEGTDGKE